jgi:hypothetical protein
MGAGISLSKNQITDIIKRELNKNFYENENKKDKYCDGYIIYETFDDEVNFKNIIRLINEFNIKYD